MFKKFAIAAVMATTTATASFAYVDTTADLDTLVSQVMLADAYIDANDGRCSGHGGAGSDSLAAAIEFRAVGDNAWYPGAASICQDRDTAFGEIAYRAQQALLNMFRTGNGNYAFIEHYQTMVTDGDLDSIVRFIDIAQGVSGIDAYGNDV